MDDARIAMFYSTIAFGVVFVVALLTAGIALDDPLVIRLAVLVAAGSYCTQALASGGLQMIAYALWAATIVAGALAVFAVVF